MAHRTTLSCLEPNDKDESKEADKDADMDKEDAADKWIDVCSCVCVFACVLGDGPSRRPKSPWSHGVASRRVAMWCCRFRASIG